MQKEVESLFKNGVLISDKVCEKYCVKLFTAKEASAAVAKVVAPGNETCFSHYKNEDIL